MKIENSVYEKIFVMLGIYFLSFTSVNGQTLAEWTQQKKTQKKYLLQQIVALQVYIGYAKKAITSPAKE
ncbi:MAG: hypothetical protein IPL04_08535 [Chitinophagaceae bacterium]|nr:hypothetical protein [Chitinophagaceae bacterium]